MLRTLFISLLSADGVVFNNSTQNKIGASFSAGIAVRLGEFGLQESPVCSMLLMYNSVSSGALQIGFTGPKDCIKGRRANPFFPVGKSLSKFLRPLKRVTLSNKLRPLVPKKDHNMLRQQAGKQALVRGQFINAAHGPKV